MPSDVTSLALLDRAAEIRAFADDIGDAGPMLPAHVTSRGAAMAIVYAGAELGMAPMQSLRSLHLVEGRVVIDATAQLAMVIRAGVSIDWERSDDRAAILILRRAGGSYRSVWTIEMAERAGLAGRKTWAKHPDAMLRARAITAGIRAFCPDVLGGAAYAPGELDDAPDPRRDVTPMSEVVAEVVAVTPARAEVVAEVVAVTHHPSWERSRGRFCARLGEMGLSYDDIADFGAAHGKPRPSSMAPGALKALLDWLADPEGRAEVDEWLGKRGEVAGG